MYKITIFAFSFLVGCAINDRDAIATDRVRYESVDTFFNIASDVMDGRETHGPMEETVKKLAAQYDEILVDDAKEKWVSWLRKTTSHDEVSEGLRVYAPDSGPVHVDERIEGGIAKYIVRYTTNDLYSQSLNFKDPDSLGHSLKLPLDDIEKVREKMEASAIPEIEQFEIESTRVLGFELRMVRGSWKISNFGMQIVSSRLAEE